MKPSEMWKIYTSTQPTNQTYEAWSFGGNADLLGELVCKGIKTATSSAYPLYELEKEPLPKTDACSIILNSKEEALCIIKTTKVYVVPFNKVSASHAYKEGEGNRSLKYWREAHKNFFTKELEAENLTFSDDMKVVCEEFEVVYKEIKL